MTPCFLFIFFFISGGPVFFDFSYGIIAAILSIIIGFFIPSKFKFYYFLIVPFALYVLLKYFIFYEELIELGKLAGYWIAKGDPFWTYSSGLAGVICASAGNDLYHPIQAMIIGMIGVVIAYKQH